MKYFIQTTRGYSNKICWAGHGHIEQKNVKQLNYCLALLSHSSLKFNHFYFLVRFSLVCRTAIRFEYREGKKKICKRWKTEIIIEMISTYAWIRYSDPAVATTHQKETKENRQRLNRMSDMNKKKMNIRKKWNGDHENCETAGLLRYNHQFQCSYSHMLNETTESTKANDHIEDDLKSVINLHLHIVHVVPFVRYEIWALSTWRCRMSNINQFTSSNI